MDDYVQYGGHLLAGRYRLPPWAEEDPGTTSLTAHDTASGEQVRVYQVPLPEVVEAAFPGEDEPPGGAGPLGGGATRTPEDPVVRRAVEAALAASRLPDHPCRDQVFDVFVEGQGLWVVGELVRATPLAVLLEETVLGPHRAAELAADLVAALRSVHVHGWVHRNLTPATVLVCDDGRAVLGSLAVGAAQEVLCGYDVLPRQEGAPPPAWDDPYRGPVTALGAERSREARELVVGAVTERWAPEQAAPAHAEGRPVPRPGPAADLWALGALLFRAVLGRAPYPEEDAADLVRTVAARDPEPAVECGPLHGLVEALLCRDPERRPSPGEVREQLAVLVRSAPEPDVGRGLPMVPPLHELGAGASRLPVLRRRGELVRHGRGRRGPGRAARRARRPGPPPAAPPRPPETETGAGTETRPAGARRRGPGRLGLWLLAAVLACMCAAVAYAVLFLPGKDGSASDGRPGGAAGSPAPSAPSATYASPQDRRTPDGSVSAAPAPEGYQLSRDPEGFAVAVPEKWKARSTPGDSRVSYRGDGLEMVLVPGRDTTTEFGGDPKVYQEDDEAELKPFRDAEWASASGLRRIQVGQRTMAEGTFGWQEGKRDRYARNRAMIFDGRYHVLLVSGPEKRKADIDRHFEAVADTYRPVASG